MTPIPPKTEAALVCPKCGESIKLTESLAAPLVAATRAQYEQQLADQAKNFQTEKQLVAKQQEANDTRAAELEAAARKQEQAVAQAVQDGIAKQLAGERKKIAEQESIRARQQVEDELKGEREAAALQKERIQDLNSKLTLARAAETDLLKKQQQLEDKERELERDLQKGIAAARTEERAKALAEVQGDLDLKVQDRDNKIAQLLTQIDSLKRKAEQSSQQAQGESLEVALEHQLRSQFPFDLIEPIAKGEFGGDVLQHVRDQSGQLCGKILWESKRTKAWSDSWLSKLKGDQRAAHADLAVIVSQTMPKDVVHFDHMEGIWVSSLGCILPVANALRVSVIELAGARRSNEGQESKAQLIYAYLTGPRFKHRIECIAEKFTELRGDLDKERKWMNKQWAKRDSELLAVLEATSGMYGDLQGIAGQSLKEIDALEGPMRLELGS
jgi:hypothetical protein